MLKIKDNVDLDELKEKYNMHIGYNQHNDNEKLFKIRATDSIRIDTSFREITIGSKLWIDNHSLYKWYGDELLYDLIKADLVEKVDD